MTFLSGFVTPIPADNRDAYLRQAEEATPIFHEFGTGRIVETWSDDVPHGQITDFWRSVKAEPGEEIGFAWHEYSDRATMDAVNEKMVSDPRMQPGSQNWVFGPHRMIYGTFEVIIDEGFGGVTGYVDAALMPVLASRRDHYLATSLQFPPLFAEQGATRVVDAWPHQVPTGETTDFYRAVAAEEGEVVVFSFIEWPSKAVRDAAWPRLFADERMGAIPAPFDESRRVWGGFVPIIDQRP